MKTNQSLEKLTLKVRLLENGAAICASNYDTLSELLASLRKVSPVDIEELLIENDYQDSYFCYTRLETDEEFEKRIKPYTAKLKLQREKEYKKYLELKEKFESGQ